MESRSEVLTLRGLVTYYVLFFIPFGQKIEAVERIVPVRRSLVGRFAAIGMMQQRIADRANHTRKNRGSLR